MSHNLYQLLSCFFFLLFFPFFLLYSGLTGRYRAGLGQRLGFYAKSRTGRAREPTIWLHAASVGEVQVARALIGEIRRQLPRAGLVVSTVTEQGFQVARQQLDQDIQCIYAPLDLFFAVRRALKFVRPTAYVCLETELWPEILRQAHEHGVKLLLLNGRLSSRSLQRYRLIRGFMSDLLARFSAISAIQPDDRKRFLALGADPDRIVVGGNAKYDLASSQPPPETPARYRRRLALTGRETVLVAGSTHSGEEALLAEVFKNLSRRLAGLIWIIAPRHLDRLDEIKGLLGEKKTSFDCLSEVDQHGRRCRVVLVDTMGELAALYSIGTFNFCGGSLVPRGGHNIMEAAVWGKPVFYGPSMKDFADARALLEPAGAGYPVRNPADLAAKILYFIDHPEEYEAAGERARRIARAQQGSARKQVRLIADALSE